MAFGKNQLLMALGFAGVAALYYGYGIYQQNPDMKLSDLANPEKLKGLAPSTPNAIEQQKSKVLGKLEEAQKAQAEREEAIARQSGEQNVHAVGEATLEGKALPGSKKQAPAPAPASSSAPVKQATAQAPEAVPSQAPSPEDTKAENDRLLAIVRGITPEAAPVKDNKPKKLAMVDSGMEDAGTKVDNSAPAAPRKACKQPPRTEVLATLKKDSPLGLGLFAEKWAEKYGSCWNELVTVAADGAQEIGVRYFALQAALEVGGRDSAPGVARLLKDKNPGLRCISLLGLGEMADKESADRIAPLLQDPAMVVRECALTATVRAEGPSALPQIISVISDSKNYVKGHPLSIVKRGFDLLDAMGAGVSQEDACRSLRERMNPGLFADTTRKWAVCTQRVEGSLTPTAAQR